MEDITRKRMLVLALFAGEIMLKNGGETYRVEDTIIRLCKSRGFKYVEAIVTPTGIYISVDHPDEEGKEGPMHSFNKRIKNRQINLEKVAKVNDFSRRFVQEGLSIEEGMKRLKDIEKSPPPFTNYQVAFFGGVTSSFFILLLGADFYEFLSAFLATIFVTYTITVLAQKEFASFAIYLIGGALAAFLAVLLGQISPEISINRVIIGEIMVMVPGVAITNGVRDSIAGDLISGMARGGEALIVAIAIAFGVGFILNLWTFMGGGL